MISLSDMKSIMPIIEWQDQRDKEIIDCALRKILYEKFSFFGNKEIYNPHVVFSGVGLREDLNAYFVERMPMYEIKSMIMTTMVMSRLNFITKNQADYYYFDESVNDDLESFYDKLRLGKKPNKSADTFFISKLTENEQELLEKKHLPYIKSCVEWENVLMRKELTDDGQSLFKPDPLEFVLVGCRRRTFKMKNSIFNCCSIQ